MRDKEIRIWKEYSKDYDKKVYSFTRFKKNRDAMLAHVKGPLILNMGTGPTAYMNKELVKFGTVIATDFCAAMLEEARRSFTHPNLSYKLADHRWPTFCECFDTVVAANSILPPQREDVYEMFLTARIALKKGGVFIAALVPMDNTRILIEHYGDVEPSTIDWENRRECDTGQWQCGHDPYTIYMEIKRAGWEKFETRILYLDDPEEIADLKRLYGYAAGEISPLTEKKVPPVYEYILTAERT